MNRVSANILTGLLIALSPRVSVGQVARTPADSIWTVELRELVVTATRTPQALERVPVSMRLITRAQAAGQASIRVSDLMEEFAELRVIRNQFGAGLQLRGLDPAYTLILIDGQPVTGRIGGTIDLDRLPTSMVERIEVVRGPSSSLYGSEALAGVVNIVTRSATKRPSAQLEYQQETHQTSNLSLTSSAGSGPFSGLVTLNRFASDGYDLVRDQPGQTVPGFVDRSMSGRLDYERGPRVKLGFRGRVANLDQFATPLFSAVLGESVPGQASGRTDWNAEGHFAVRPAPQIRVMGSVFLSNSDNFNDLADPGNPEQPLRTDFSALYRKAESQADWVQGTSHHITVGAGAIGESARGQRIAGGQRSTRAGFGFLQHEFAPEGPIQITSSVRVDGHSDYGTHVSPKVAGLLSVGAVQLRLSAGSGFKAPTFQQLYLDFTNPGAGYSVVGTSDLTTALGEFESAGQIAYLLGDPGTFGKLLPETARSFEFGIDGDVGSRVRARASVFTTRLRDMIETQPVAGKPNGQFIFSYVNLGRVEIRGVEADITWKPLRSVSIRGGYQFLQARDLDVLDRITQGTVFRRIGGQDQRLQRSDYGGLFNRPRHSATLRFGYSRGGTSAILRIVYRDRYGLGDLNGNLILDDRAEYAPAYTLVNATLTHRASARLTLSAGVRNLTNKTFPTLVPSLSGRILQAGINLSLPGNRRIP
jgi:outer membrane receptor for ferrienterochelin and colicins